jgi:hypothetical protein
MITKLLEKYLKNHPYILELREKLIDALDRIVDLEKQVDALEKETRHVRNK